MVHQAKPPGFARTPKRRRRHQARAAEERASERGLIVHAPAEVDMAPWIKCSSSLFGKREVLVIARALGVKNNEVAGACLRFWAWADGETTDGFVPGVTLTDVDQRAELPGLAEQMVRCGWLAQTPVENPVGVLLINFGRHMGQSAKARALHAMRQERYRKNQKDGGR